MAQSHENLAAKIATDVEGALRQYSATNRELATISNTSGNLAALARELTSAQKKAQKLDAKGSNKVEGARSDVDDALASWNSQAPYIFEQLQSIDEARIEHLKSVLTQFQTHELDQVERSRASAESCLNVLLNVETADEIKTFAVKTTAQAGSGTARRESVTSSSRPSGANVPPAPPPPRNANIEQRNSSLPGQDRLPPGKHASNHVMEFKLTMDSA